MSTHTSNKAHKVNEFRSRIPRSEPHRTAYLGQPTDLHSTVHNNWLTSQTTLIRYSDVRLSFGDPYSLQSTISKLSVIQSTSTCSHDPQQQPHQLPPTVKACILAFNNKYKTVHLATNVQCQWFTKYDSLTLTQPVPLPPCPTNISRGLARDRSWVSAVRGRKLTARPDG